MLAIEWKMFLGRELGRNYFGWVAYLDAVKKGNYRGWRFLYSRNGG
jgi:hypothetical protein